MIKPEERKEVADGVPRTLKRVRLDFDWPLDRVWKGYIPERYGETEPYEPPYGDGYQLWRSAVKERRSVRFSAHWRTSLIGVTQMLPSLLTKPPAPAMARRVP